MQGIITANNMKLKQWFPQMQHTQNERLGCLAEGLGLNSVERPCLHMGGLGPVPRTGVGKYTQHTRDNLQIIKEIVVMCIT